MPRRRVAKNGDEKQTQTPMDELAASSVLVDEAADINRWRLKNDGGRLIWHYLRTDEEAEAWPQTLVDRHFLGLPLNLPPLLPRPKTALDAARNGVSFFSRLQMEPGNWGSEYGGPMFLLPGLVVAWYVTRTAIPRPYALEIRRYLYARQNPLDGGWGLHVEGESTVFGTVLNYVAMRIVGVPADDHRMTRARALLHSLGGAVNAPLWGKFWLCVLGVAEWDVLNPAPPELWLLPDWVPIAPWRWWIHLRQVFLPMSYISSRKYSHPLDPLTCSLREELYIQPYESIDFLSHRNSISPRDNQHPKSTVLNCINWVLVNVWNPYLRTDALASRAEDWAYRLIEHEGVNTAYTGLGPVNAAMNLVAAFVREGTDAASTRAWRERLVEFLWMGEDGMLMNGTNGVQCWDTSFAVQAVVEAGLASEERFRPMLVAALEFLEEHQIRDDVVDQERCYRQRRKGAWGFSTADQGYTVSDCTSESLKAVLMLQSLPAAEVGAAFPKLISDERIRDAVDTLLTMQNATGGFSSYEPTRGSHRMELLNAAEVFNNIMVEYDYPECTTAVVTALLHFRSVPGNEGYRKSEIDRTLESALQYIRRAQRPDGSWYGSWGICFTYAGMFALESLAAAGETCGNSTRVRKACEFLLSKQRRRRPRREHGPAAIAEKGGSANGSAQANASNDVNIDDDGQDDDGGWGESYKSCETGQWVEHEHAQVVQTCWALIALMHAECPDREAVEQGIRLVMRRQMPDGGWRQEAIEGVFNKSTMITYPNYKYYFSIKALGMFARKYGNPAVIS